MRNKLKMKLLQYSIDNCKSCDQISNLLTKINIKDILLDKIDAASLSPESLKQAGIKTVPTLVLLNDKGQEVSRKSGALTKKQLEDFLGV